MAERKKAIDLIGAAQSAEREALRLTSAAQAEKAASADRGAAIRAEAEADAEANKIRSLALRVRAEIEARGGALDERGTTCYAGSAHVGAALKIVEKRQGRDLRESVFKTMERIEGIKILLSMA